MDRTAEAYESLVARFTAWAQTEEGIRAVFVIGSRARIDHPADEWADLDVLVVARDPAPYLTAEEWIRCAGTPWLTFVEATGDGRSQERRVLYEGGLDVDFAFVPVTLLESLLAAEVPPDVADMISRGVRVLLDRDGLVDRLRSRTPAAPAPPMPTQEQYLEVVSDFWYHAVWCAKHLRRGELWWAKEGCDSHMKRLLRTMLEWHARATGRGDTWFRGRFLEEWADPRALREMPEGFAHYETSDVRRALFATMDLFRWLAAETAQRSGYVYPHEADAKTTEFVRRILPERDAA